MTGAAILQASHLTLRIDGRDIVRDIGFSLAPGDNVALLGRNGAGKTSLLRLLLGFIPPSAGSIAVAGKPLASHSRRELARHIAYVPQAHAAAFPFTVYEMVAMGRASAAGYGRKLAGQDEAAVIRAMDSLGLGAFRDWVYAELSGGERQAVLIARALAQGARILLMDEPAASLDLRQQARLFGLLAALAEQGYAILVSLHQPQEALRWFNRAILLDQGRIVSDAPPDISLTEENLSRLYQLPVLRIDTPSGIFLKTALPDQERQDCRESL